MRWPRSTGAGRSDFGPVFGYWSWGVFIGLLQAQFILFRSSFFVRRWNQAGVAPVFRRVGCLCCVRCGCSPTYVHSWTPNRSRVFLSTSRTTLLREAWGSQHKDEHHLCSKSCSQHSSGEASKRDVRCCGCHDSEHQTKALSHPYIRTEYLSPPREVGLRLFKNLSPLSTLGGFV